MLVFFRQCRDQDSQWLPAAPVKSGRYHDLASINRNGFVRCGMADVQKGGQRKTGFSGVDSTEKSL
jgi:hypothetical protein